MNLLINKEKMLVLHKHESQAVVRNLADLEATDVHTSGIYCDNPDDFKSFTDLELKLLIKSMGGDARHNFSHGGLQCQAYELACLLPCSDVDAFELELQVRTLHPEDGRTYRYVKGSNKPRLVEDGVEELAALQAPANAVGSAASAPNAAGQGIVAPQAAKPLPAAEDGFAFPREGTSTHTIFMFCANMWKESNYTESKQVFDGIRKAAVAQLVAQGLNVSTVRVQQARWYQYRARLVD